MSETLKIRKIDEVFFHVDCSSGVKTELKEHFSFFVPNHRFHPKVKEKMWDGRIFLFNLGMSRLYIGLFMDFFRFCDGRGYRIEFADDVLKDSVTPNELTEDDAKILDDIPSIYSPRDYQMNAIVHAIRNQRSIILSSTGCLDGCTEIDCYIDA